MSEQIGAGSVIKSEGDYYLVKTPEGKWVQVCTRDDPFWSVKCIKVIEKLYPADKN
jgi:hypothetical protein